MSKFKEANLIILVFTVISTFLLLTWILLDKSSFAGDSAGYAIESVRFYRAIETKEKIVETFFSLNHRRKTPLIVMMPAPFHFFLKDTKLALMSPSIIIFALTIPIFYLLVKKLFSLHVALLSVFILFTIPLIYGYSRLLYPDFFLMAFSIWWFYALFRCKNFSETKWNIILGIITGLGFMTKATFFSIITLPSIYTLAKRLKEDGFKITNRTIIDLLCIAIPAILIFGAWYFYNFRVLAWQLKRSAYGPASVLTSLGPIFSLFTILKYWGRFITYGISSYYFILFAYAFVLNLFHNKLRKINIHPIILLWFFVPFLLQTFGGTKELRYISPALPAFAIITSVLVFNIIRSKLISYTKLLIFLLLPVLLFLNASFHLSIKIPDLKIANLIFMEDEISYPGHPVSMRPQLETWPTLEILNFIKSDATINDYPIHLMVVREESFLDSSTLDYDIYLNNLPFKNMAINGRISDLYITPSITAAYQQVNNAKYVLTTDSAKQDSWIAYRYDNQIRNDLLDGKLPFKLINSFSLPNGTKALIFKKI